ncbi:MAG: hypothetical protein KIT22_10160 [Verrucomicrobiae bacterium]|nr:hypothetical protein [Verrucomicrobiae bacterium]
MKGVPLSGGARSVALLAINLLFLMVWGFSGVRKLLQGFPAWFPEKFGATFLATFPGLHASFWMLVLAELLALLLAVVALLRGEFFGRRLPLLLQGMLAWSLLVFVQLGFGQWLTGDFASAAQLFAYFAGTLICLRYVEDRSDAGA